MPEEELRLSEISRLELNKSGQRLHAARIVYIVWKGKIGMRILFIGNSYTYYNRMPETLAHIARAESLDWTVESVTKGGWSFAHYIHPEDEMHAPLKEKLAQAWDCILLQEQSLRPVDGRDTFLRTAEALCGMISPRPAKLIYYVTWGRDDASPQLEKLGMSRLEMTERLHDAYAEAARRTNGILSDVGGAFAYTRAHFPHLPLYHTDGSHPSPEGSYLAALIHYHTITGTLPEKIRYIPEGLDAATLEEIRLAAGEFIALAKKEAK